MYSRLALRSSCFSLPSPGIIEPHSQLKTFLGKFLCGHVFFFLGASHHYMWSVVLRSLSFPCNHCPEVLCTAGESNLNMREDLKCLWGTVLVRAAFTALVQVDFGYSWVKERKRSAGETPEGADGAAESAISSLGFNPEYLHQTSQLTGVM